MILVVGSGFLGSYLLKYAVTQTDEPILATVRDLRNTLPLKNVKYIQCDVTKRADLTELAKECKEEPLKVFFLAACHNIDFVYQHPQEAWNVNVESLKQFLSVFSNIDKLIFASSDCVYGENNNKYPKFNEESDLNPVNEYGRQKAAAEKIVQSAGFTAVRLPFMLGPSLLSKPHFYDRICSDLSNNNPIEMIDGLRRSVLSFHSVAEILVSLASLPIELPEALNVCGDTDLSKYEIGCILAQKIRAPLSLVKKISEEQGEKFFKDKRASCSIMDNKLLKSLLGLTEELQWEENICL
ncbi:MAG: NAD-dependent epimerase/dehydratase family protein [Acutalibacteraceae bacterium]